MLHMCFLCRKASHVCSYLNVRAETTMFLEVVEGVRSAINKDTRCMFEILF